MTSISRARLTSRPAAGCAPCIPPRMRAVEELPNILIRSHTPPELGTHGDYIPVKPTLHVRAAYGPRLQRASTALLAGRRCRGPRKGAASARCLPRRALVSGIPSRDVPGDVSPLAQGLRRAVEQILVSEEAQRSPHRLQESSLRVAPARHRGPYGLDGARGAAADLFRFAQWQACIRKLEADDPAASYPKHLLAAWDDPVLPAEYYASFPRDYLRDSASRSMGMVTASLPGY